MTLHYTLTVDDLVVFNQFVLKRIIRRFILPFVMPLFLAVYVLGFLTADKTTTLATLVVTDAITVVGFIGLTVSLFYPRQIAIGFSVFIVIWLLLGIYSGALLAVLTLVPQLILAAFSGTVILKVIKHHYTGKNDMLSPAVPSRRLWPRCRPLIRLDG